MVLLVVVFALAHPRNSLLILVSSVGAFPRSPSSLFEVENVWTRSPGQVGRPHWWAFVWTDQWVSALYIFDYGSLVFREGFWWGREWRKPWGFQE